MYDLWFVARSGVPLPEAWAIALYFESLGNAKIEMQQARYANPVTGVSMDFDLDLSPRPISLGLEYLRPSIFALEAAEIACDLVSKLPLDVDDPQTGKRGVFDRAGFLEMWGRGNAHASRSGGPPQLARRYSRERLVSQWNWNRSIALASRSIGNAFAAKVAYRRDESGVRAFAKLALGEPTAIPRVDDVVLLRPKAGLARTGACDAVVVSFERLMRETAVNFTGEGDLAYLRFAGSEPGLAAAFASDVIDEDAIGAISTSLVVDAAIE